MNTWSVNDALETYEWYLRYNLVKCFLCASAPLQTHEESLPLWGPAEFNGGRIKNGEKSPVKYRVRFNVVVATARVAVKFPVNST